MRLGTRMAALAIAVGFSAWLVHERFEDIVTQGLLLSLRRALVAEVGSERARRILSRMKGHLAILEAGELGRARGIMRFHKANAMAGLSLYRALADEEVEGDPVEETGRLLWVSEMSGLTEVLARMLERSADPYALFEKGVRFANRWIFPSPHWEKKEVEVEDGVGFDFSGCFYHDYFRGKGAPELTGAYCRMDFRMDDRFPYQVELERRAVLAEGGEVCDFRYYHRRNLP